MRLSGEDAEKELRRLRRRRHKDAAWRRLRSAP